MWTALIEVEFKEGEGGDMLVISVGHITFILIWVQVEVQFQMNRMHFINMHYALDQLTDTDIVFPDVTKINPVLNERHTLKVV